MGRWTEVQMPIEMINALGIDMYYVSPRSGVSVHTKSCEDGSFTDEWGCYWKKTATDGGHFYFELVNPPLANATIEDLESYEWPNPEDPKRYAGLKVKIMIGGAPITQEFCDRMGCDAYAKDAGGAVAIAVELCQK